jgi:hypothetical protein
MELERMGQAVIGIVILVQLGMQLWANMLNGLALNTYLLQMEALRPKRSCG